MSTRETRTERVVQHSTGHRPLSPHGTSQLDNNLDNLLEDLQNSVSKPALNGSGVHGGNYREYSSSTVKSSGSGGTLGRTNDSRIEYRSAANPITVPSESQSTKIVEKSKDGSKEKTVYKTYKYEYDVSDSVLPESSSTRMQSNINQLDTLLDDLQQARKGANINAGIDPGLLEPLDSSLPGGKKSVQRELVYEKSESRSSRGRQLSPTAVRRSDREGSVTREVTYTIDDGTYGDIRHKPLAQPLSNTSTIEKNTNISRSYNASNTLQSTKNITTTSDDILHSEILSDLDPSLLPNPNTKVTTTIKTYTYEIPGAPAAVPNTGYPSRIQSVSNVETSERFATPSPQALSRNEMYTYKNESYNTASKTIPVQYPVDSRPRSPYSQTTLYREENRTDNYYSGTPSPQPPPTNYQKSLYKEDVRTTNTYGDFVPNRPKRDYSPPGNKTIIHKVETRDTHHGYNPNSEPLGRPYTNTYPPRPDQNISINYKYTSEQTSSNTYHDYPPYGSPVDDRKPLLQPGRFPTDQNDSGPPKRLDELMATFDGTEHSTTTNIYNTTTKTVNNRYQEDDSKQKLISPNTGPQAVVDAQKKKDIKDLPKTRNVAGPPVYYPPGHEMFAKKEESAAAYRAQGGYMRAAGKYEYEAESNSKSKTKTKSAVVPVCLPLCCAMPCVIL